MTNDGYLGLNWSSDEGQIVFVSSPEGQGNYGSELFVIDVNSSNLSEQSEPEQITYNNSTDVLVSNPTWKPCEVPHE
jgi:Tol biopolymer transport system component